jgi:hypothetical protein
MTLENEEAMSLYKFRPGCRVMLNLDLGEPSPTELRGFPRDFVFIIRDVFPHNDTICCRLALPDGQFFGSAFGVGWFKLVGNTINIDEGVEQI